MLHRACAQCGRFLAAATRRCLGRFAVPVWLIVLTDQLPVAGLVGHYPTNNLMGRTPLRLRLAAFLMVTMSVRGISSPFGGVFRTSGQVRTCSSAVRHSRSKGPCVRLTCVRHAASVDPEPGSNSSKDGEAAEQQATIDRAVPGVVTGSGACCTRQLVRCRRHKSEWAIERTANSAGMSPCSSICAGARDGVVADRWKYTRRIARWQGARCTSFEPVSSALAHETVAHDEREYTRPSWQAQVFRAVDPLSSS